MSEAAKSGFSAGGRAPFGFRRWLAKLDGTVVRQLDDGEYVRMQGHHVVWLPGPQEEIDLALRIRDMLPASLPLGMFLLSGWGEFLVF